MNIKSNTKFISIFPITILLILTIYLGMQEYQKFQSIQATKQKFKTIDTLFTLLKNSTKERELAIVKYIQNPDGNKLDRQYQKTNETVTSIVKLYNQDKSDKLIFKIIKDIKKVVSIRKGISSATLSYDKIFSTYDTLNSDILLKISSLTSHIKPDIDKKVESYINTITLYKSVNDERDFIAKNYSSDASMDNLYMVKVFKDSNLYNTFSLLDENLKKVLSERFNNSNFFKLIEETTKIKKDILNKGFHKDSSISRWYELEDKKVGEIENIINISKDEINNSFEKEGEITIAKMILFGVLFLTALYMLLKYFKVTKYLFDTHYIKLLLQKSVDSSTVTKKIDLDTTEGVESAYKLIDVSLDKIEIDRQRAQNENASKSIFLANMSHEIRTPINGIVGFTELLKKSNLNSEQREYIDIVSKSTDNLLEIINNILDLSKIESQKVEIESITFSPIEEFENSINLFIAKAVKKDINLSLLMDVNFDSYLVGDSLKLKEVLLNLISNAIKFTPNGGDISLKVKKQLSEKYDFEKIYFEVTDNGIGMTEDELSEVFDAFTQANSTITRKYGGTGLGLTISSNYVSLMGGKLEVSSRKNEGTSFFFTLEFKKSQPLKTYKYKDSFKEIVPLIITDEKNIDIAKQLKKYTTFFTSTSDYIKIDKIEQNVALFDRANLIIVTKDLYEKNDFSYLKQINKKLLIVHPTKDYHDKSIKNTQDIIHITQPLSFYKMVEVLTMVSPNHDTSMLSYKEQKSKEEKKNHKLLIAEDNLINMKLIKQIFNPYKNITIVEAEDGQKAIDAFMTEKFDLVLMDIAMPVVDGVSATKKIKEYEEINNLTHTPVIALTANALKGDKEKFMSEGLDEYLTKPIKEEALFEMLNKFSITLSKEESVTKAVEDVQENTKEDSKTTLPQKDILIFKKSTVETKIFQKVLKNIYKEVDIAKESDEFLSKLKETNYKAILLDSELNNISIEKLVDLKKSYHNSAFILFRNFETKVDNRLRAIFDEIVINSADEEYLKTILENYIK